MGDRTVMYTVCSYDITVFMDYGSKQHGELSASSVDFHGLCVCVLARMIEYSIFTIQTLIINIQYRSVIATYFFRPIHKCHILLLH